MLIYHLLVFRSDQKAECVHAKAGGNHSCTKGFPPKNNTPCSGCNTVLITCYLFRRNWRNLLRSCQVWKQPWIMPTSKIFNFFYRFINVIDKNNSFISSHREITELHKLNAAKSTEVQVGALYVEDAQFMLLKYKTKSWIFPSSGSHVKRWNDSQGRIEDCFRKVKKRITKRMRYVSNGGEPRDVPILLRFPFKRSSISPRKCCDIEQLKFHQVSKKFMFSFEVSDLQGQLSRSEQQAARREDKLKQEILDIQMVKRNGISTIF